MNTEYKLNETFTEQIQRKNYEIHRDKLQQIKNNRMYLIHRQPDPCKRKPSNKYEKERIREIQKQNSKLFNRVNEIMSRNGQGTSSNFHMYRKQRNKTERLRIESENRKILERINNQKPTISCDKLKEERKKSVEMMRIMRKYRSPRGRSHTSMSSTDPHQQSTISKKKQFSLSHHDREIPSPFSKQFQQKIDFHPQKTFLPEQDPKKSTQLKITKTGPLKRNSKIDKLSNLPIEKMIERNSSSNRENPSKNSLILLYKSKINLLNSEGIVSIERDYDTYRIRVVFESPVYKSYYHQVFLREEQGNQFFSDFNYDYPKIISMLTFDRESLTINLPNSHKTKK